MHLVIEELCRKVLQFTESSTCANQAFASWTHLTMAVRQQEFLPLVAASCLLLVK